MCDESTRRIDAIPDKSRRSTMEFLTYQDVTSRDNIQVFDYVLNTSGIKSLEFGAFFLFVIAASIYPATMFEPWAWLVVSIVLGIAGIAILAFAQYWRIFAKRAVLAYDDVHLFVGSDKRRIRAIPWSSLDIESAGLKDPKSGADLKMTLGNTSVRVRLFTPFVCIPHFDNVLAVILTHIQENAKAAQKGEKRRKA